MLAMRRFYRFFWIAAVGLIGVAIGLGIGTKWSKAPARIGGASDPSKDAEAALDSAVAEVDFEETPFEDAVKQLQQKSPVPIVVHWSKLKKAGIDRRTPITFRARSVTLGRALHELTRPLSAAGSDVVYGPSCA